MPARARAPTTKGKRQEARRDEKQPRKTSAVAASPPSRFALSFRWVLCSPFRAFLRGSGRRKTFAVAASSIVGRRLGENRPDEAERAAWRTVFHCSIACGTWGCVLLAGGELLASFFVEAGPTRDLASAYYRIIALCLVPLGVSKFNREL